MKKAVVVGGSNGIGLSIANKLMQKDYHVLIVDREEPEKSLIYKEDLYAYYFCNLLDFNIDFFAELSRDETIEVLMITAGIGRVADFEYIHHAEIINTFQINTVSCIAVLNAFYRRIKSRSNFYCGVMGSIAGWISSPAMALYAASKAGLCRFIESINIELEVGGVNNRILNISPGSVKGTKFNGGENNLELLDKLTDEIMVNLFNSKEIFIPDYDEIYKDVIGRYTRDPHKYGLESYIYKTNSNRVQNTRKVCIGYLSGTFDLFHVGHLNILKRAKSQCDYLIVGVHHDASHKNKETFISFDERKAIVSSCKYVDKVVDSCAEDSDAWNLYKYDKLFVGSDYKNTDRFKKYEEYFKNKDVEIIYLPYTKDTSSTQIRSNILSKKQ